jgi:exopolyphosphatase / guanosine-5'-triphosphate,3'-diphosphate pyrophosphatase
MRIASIDIGTNTIRLLVADLEKGDCLTPITRKDIITRLGEGFSRSGKISDPAMQRTIAGLTEFRALIDNWKTDRVRAVATSVVRAAPNGVAFLRRVREETGIEVCAISGETEAHLAVRGALLPVHDAYDQALIFDIGGGSTEFIVTRGTVPIEAISVDLGVVHLTERHLRHDPPLASELAAIENDIAGTVQTVRERLDAASFPARTPSSRALLIGIAGTPTTLAALDLALREYDRDRVHNHLLSRERIAELYQQLITLPSAQRLLLPGLQAGREDLIIPGSLITVAVMDSFGFPVLRVIDSGILEGLILSYSSSPGASIPCFSRR